MADVNAAVIYYSSTSHTYTLARRIADAAEQAGAEVRLRKVRELAPPEAIAANPAWQQHADATKDVEEAVADDIVWADAVFFGSPTRYGNVSSQLKQYMDSLGPQWLQGLLGDKTYSGFTGSQTAHGGQETTLLAMYNTVYHWGGIIVPPGYTDALKFNDGNPYGVSHVSGAGNDIDPGEAELTACDHMARRAVRYARAIKRADATA